MIKYLKNELMSENIHPEVWSDKNSDGNVSSELGYLRADHDGYRWWNKFWPVNPSLLTVKLRDEFNMVYDSFRKAFKDREDMAAWCHKSAAPTADDTEFNAFLELEHGYYWFRLITRRGDYNLYLHCYSRKAMKEVA